MTTEKREEERRVMNPVMNPVMNQGRTAVRARAIRRRRARGAALVEAAFLSPLFVILFFAGVFAHNLFSTKLDMIQTARANAWNYAMTNCSQGQGDQHWTQADWGNSAANDKAITGDIPNPTSWGSPPGVSGGGKGSSSAQNGMGGIEKVLGGLLANPTGAQSAMTKNISYRIPNIYTHSDGKGIGQAGSTVTLFCNEEAQNGSIGAVFNTIFNAIGISF
jgi:Flp pilus assembly protein TadG